MLIYLTMIHDPCDRNMFEQVYLRYRQTMFHVANAILHDEALAEDAVHEAFINIAKEIKKIVDPTCHKTRSYIVYITRNCAIDMYRKRRRQPAVGMEEWMMGVEMPQEDSLLQAALVALPEDYRRILVMRYVQGNSDKEIANCLRITQEAVRQRVSRAKKRLAALLEEEGITV